MRSKNFLSVKGGIMTGLAVVLTVGFLALTPAYEAMADEAKGVADKVGQTMINEHGHGRHHFRGPNGETPQQMKEKFAQKLGLTAEQKEKIEKMREEDKAKMEPLMKKMSELREEMHKIRQESRNRFESVLTDEQKAKLKDMRSEMLSHRLGKEKNAQ